MRMEIDGFTRFFDLEEELVTDEDRWRFKSVWREKINVGFLRAHALIGSGISGYALGVRGGETIILVKSGPHILIEVVNISSKSAGRVMCSDGDTIDGYGNHVLVPPLTIWTFFCLTAPNWVTWHSKLDLGIREENGNGRKTSDLPVLW